MFAWLRARLFPTAHSGVAARPQQPTKSFKTKIVGVIHRNPDGRKRQDVLMACRRGDPVELRPEPDNRHDSLAVAVYVRGAQAGYLSSEVAASFASQTRRNNASAVVHSIVGGTPEMPSLGLIVTVSLRKK